MNLTFKFLTLLCCLSSTLLTGGTVTFSDNVLIIPLAEITALTQSSLISDAPIDAHDAAVRGHSITIANMLNGMAVACSHAGKVVSKNEAQQGVFGTIAAGLATAASLILANKEAREQKKHHAALASQLTKLAVALEAEATRIPCTDQFIAFRSCNSAEAKAAYIANLMQQDEEAEQFIGELMTVAGEFMAQHHEELSQALKLRAEEVFLSWLAAQLPAEHATPIPLEQLMPHGVVIYAPSADATEAAQVVQQVTDFVANRVASAYADMLHGAYEA